jgi:signal transduction histidine kinase
VVRELREATIRRERAHVAEVLRVMARRARFLADVSRALASSLNYEDTLAQAASAPLGEVADWCVVAVVDEPAAPLRTVVRHVQPALERRAREHLARWPLALQGERGAAAVIRNGRLQWTSPETALLTTAPDEERRALARDLGHRAGVCLPLVARGRTIGAMTLVRACPGGDLGPHDLGFVEELAGRAALALDNATLYWQAREGVRARDEFLSVASHELYTPLATLTLQLDEIMRNHRAATPEGDAERMLKGLGRARRQVDRLSRLVMNLLDVSRLAADALPLSPADTDLVAITREVVEQFTPDLTRAGCAVRLEAPATLVGNWDPLRLTQVVTNLISNALKYGAGAPIEVVLATRGSNARLTVRDHGIGIAAADVERVFGRFERAVSARHYGGLGLGLYITRQVVEAHGGAIRVSSHTGQGSTFEVDLPLAPAEPQPRQQTDERSRKADLDR